MLIGVPGLRVAGPPIETLRDDGPSPEGKLPEIPSPLGVPRLSVTYTLLDSR